MVKTLPTNSIAEVYITHLDGVLKWVLILVSIVEMMGARLLSYMTKKNKASKFVKTKINLDELRWEEAKYNQKKDKNDEMKLKHSEGDEYNMNENKGLHDLEMDPDYEWIGIWDTTKKDEKIVKLHEKAKENAKKKVTQKGGVDEKEREKGKEKKKELVIKINK